MTSSPGFQAIRDNANAQGTRPYIERLPTVAQLNALLNLTEALAGAAQRLRDTDGHEGVPWDAGPNLAAQRELDAALDKYREFE